MLKLMIISGGQTGFDRAALDEAIARGIAYGGWCPQGLLGGGHARAASSLLYPF
jgi:Circularly permutated YpsA SLOG family